MADISLKIESGEKEIELINAKSGSSVNVIIAVYDILFLYRIMDAAEQLDGLRKEVADLITDNMSNEKFRLVGQKALETDPKMRAIVDDLLGAPVCDTLFPRQSMFTIGNGAQTWENILYSVIDQMDGGLAAEKEKARARIRKYSEKYKR